jgi:hypothetical protein
MGKRPFNAVMIEKDGGKTFRIAAQTEEPPTTRLRGTIAVSDLKIRGCP